MVRTFAVNEIALQQKRFTPYTVVTFIVFLVDIPLRFAVFPNLLNTVGMFQCCGAIERVIADMEFAAKLFPLGNEGIKKVLRGLVVSSCCCEKFLAMFINAEVEKDLI